MHGCGFGIAVFDRIEEESFNPNISLEVGYMLALKKPLCILKDRTLKTLHSDLVGRLYRVFDPLDPKATIYAQIAPWLRDKGFA
jgi:nucleoside 2-deoxyribosyltransferase